MFLAGHFVNLACVFMHIVGSLSIFNISTGQPLVSHPEKHIGEPPPFARAGTFASFGADSLQPTVDSKPLAPVPNPESPTRPSSSRSFQVCGLETWKPPRGSGEWSASVLESGARSQPIALCLLPTVLWIAPTPCLGRRSCPSARGYWP